MFRSHLISTLKSAEKFTNCSSMHVFKNKLLNLTKQVFKDIEYVICDKKRGV